MTIEDGVTRSGEAEDRKSTETNRRYLRNSLPAVSIMYALRNTIKRLVSRM